VSADAKESFKVGRNYSKTDVLGMDFSSFKKPGRYRVFVEGIAARILWRSLTTSGHEPSSFP